MHPKGFVQKVLLSTIAVGIAINSPAQTVTYTITDLGTLPGGTTSSARDINEAGQVVGFAENSAGVDRAFLYSNCVRKDLGTLPSGTTSSASGINEAGQVVGDFITSEVGEGGFHVFLYSNSTGAMQDLGNLGGFFGFSTDINDAGQVVGFADTLGIDIRAFLYSNGAMKNLGTLPGGTTSSASGLNEAGQVVGTADNSAGVDRAFLYSNGAMQDLNTLLPVGSGWVLHEAYAINNAGEIIGSGRHNDATRTFLLKPGN
jgi:probable HAF family extracellular repeat protein